MSNTHYVYVLEDEAQAVRYVGQTRDVISRMTRHTCPSGSKLWEWLCTLQEQPELRVICVVQGRDEALRVEDAWVDVLLKRGVQLLNKTWSMRDRLEHGALIAKGYENAPAESRIKSDDTKRLMSIAARESWRNGRKGTPRDMSKARAARWPEGGSQ